jgi:glycosyltransferase involved in cell wall biosynthesis
MRVLITADTVGGVWTYAVELARASAFHDCEIAIVAMGSPLREDQRSTLESLPHVTIYELPGRLEWMDDPWEDVEASCRELRRIADDFAPDLIHANSYCHAAMGWDVPVLLVAHSCVVSWFAEVRGEEPGPEWNRYRRTVRQALDAADLVVAPTAAMLGFLERSYGRVESTKAIPNGVGTRINPPSAPDPGYRRGSGATGSASAEADSIVQHVDRDQGSGTGRASGTPAKWLTSNLRRATSFASRDAKSLLSQKERAVFAAGRMWDEAKNLVAVARAADRIAAPIRVASLPHPDGHDLQHAGVEYLGPLDRAGMDEQFRRAAVFAHPAKYEPFGLTPLEAALHGCALVLGDIPTLREIWGDGAQFVRPDDVEALADAVNRLLDDEGRRKALVEKSLQRASRLTADRMARAFVEQYARLCARQPQETR